MSSISEKVSLFGDLFKEYGFAIEAVLVLVITILLVLVEVFVYKRLSARIKKKNKLWEKAILNGLHRPLYSALWFVGCTYTLEVLFLYVENQLVFSLLASVRKIGVTFLLVWFFLSFIKEIEKILLVPRENRRHLDKTTVRAIGQVMRVIVVISSVFIIMQSIFGVGASAILAFAGGGGLTIGWAAKDLIANFFGGLMIFLDRPFSIGDRVSSPDRKIEGFVEHIGWRLTRIRTYDRYPLYVPNSIFLNITVENPSRMTNRRIKSYVGVRYEDAKVIGPIANDIRSYLEASSEVDQERGVVVNFVNFGSSSLEILYQCYTKATAWAEFTQVKQDINLKILEIIHSHSADCAFPTTTVHIPEAIQTR